MGRALMKDAAAEHAASDVQASLDLEGTEVMIVRHGRTTWNEEGRIQGSGDAPLTEAGEIEAVRLGERLAMGLGRKPTVCYSSPLRRATRTAEILCGHLGLQICVEEDLRERAYGCLEGLTSEEQKAQHPEAHKRNRAREDEYEIPGGGESRANARKRVLAVIKRIALRHAGQRVLIVTHSGVLSTLATTLIGAKVNAGRPGPVLPNVAINLFRWQGGSEGGWQLVLWGDKGDFACETPLAGQSYRPYWSLAACTGLAFVAGAFAGSRLRSITP